MFLQSNNRLTCLLCCLPLVSLCWSGYKAMGCSHTDMLLGSSQWQNPVGCSRREKVRFAYFVMVEQTASRNKLHPKSWQFSFFSTPGLRSTCTLHPSLRRRWTLTWCARSSDACCRWRSMWRQRVTPWTACCSAKTLPETGCSSAPVASTRSTLVTWVIQSSSYQLSCFSQLSVELFTVLPWTCWSFIVLSWICWSHLLYCPEHSQVNYCTVLNILKSLIVLSWTFSSHLLYCPEHSQVTYCTVLNIRKSLIVLSWTCWSHSLYCPEHAGVIHCTVLNMLWSFIVLF